MKTVDSPNTNAGTSGAKEYDRVLRVGTQHVNISAVTHKVLEDIGFLRERIHLINQQRNPNPIILSTFEKMLESRESVLSWLQEQSPAQTAQAEAQHRSQRQAS